MLVPSLPAASFAELASLAVSLRGVARELQVDIVDGRFVPAVSWPFTEAEPLAELTKISLLRKDFAIEMDCMVLEPEKYLDIFVGLGVSRVVIHMGSTEKYDDIFAHAREYGYKIGLAMMNDRPVTDLAEYLDDITFVQVMGIATIGKQGQPFDVRTLETVKKISELYPQLEIAVDGSVNKDTIMRLQTAGVDRFLPGSAIAKTPDPKASYLEMMSMLGESNKHF